ncbi:poly(U)-specific endoribonuclease homolog isoform X2 [Thrips palmi]|uniref:Poly(U)-specific endoribonuclease homolog isoform X2 n=1 Tax=Thrips palmi TaxID=161013 RepID=A0A6P8Y3X2_THRPL|nr:poly(U)-specific endoribonuclease homolog isoform X2 [Thrips palmi]
MARVLLVVCLAALCAGWSSASTDRTHGGNKVSDSDIKKLTEQLFTVDKHALNSAVRIDLQGKTYSSATDDKAPRPLLSVDESRAKSANGNVALLARLYDKYTPDCTKAEKETPEKKQQQSDLLDGLLATPVLTTTLNFLAGKGLVPTGKAAQKQFLNKLWFSLYSRGGGALGSSAFEHVFLGELKHGDVSGMHSWLFFNKQEEAGKADYKGYIKKLPLGEVSTASRRPSRVVRHGATVQSVLLAS